MFSHENIPIPELRKDKSPKIMSATDPGLRWTTVIATEQDCCKKAIEYFQSPLQDNKELRL